MAVRVSCPNPGCEAIASVEEQSLGKRGRCKKCGHVFTLTMPDDLAVSENAPASKIGSPQSVGPINLPEQFGRYRIMKKLGQGGMGAVYLAQDTKLQREVALKVPFFSPADGPEAVQRFEREARAAATLNHPNLCQVFDVGEIDGIHYLTMPYIQGKPLSEVIGRDQAMNEAQAAAIAFKLAQALQEAHDQGIIHRDLKPGNIMVNRRRELIVMDFGLARVVGVDNEPLTRSGNVLGTALYMAPEQAAGDLGAIGPPADVYSLGVILYELLTGRYPFEGPWGLVIGLKNVKDPDPPSKHRPDLSPTLDAICHKAIAKAPNDRHATMSELARELGAFLKTASNPVLTPSGTVHPDERPESLAAKAFAGRIESAAGSGLEETRPGGSTLENLDGKPRRPGRRQILLIAGIASLAILGLIGYWMAGPSRSTGESSPEPAFVPFPFDRNLSGWKEPENGTAVVSDDGVLTLTETTPGKPAILETEREDFRNFRLRFEILSPDDIRKALVVRVSHPTSSTVSGYAVSVGGTKSPKDGKLEPVGSILVYRDTPIASTSTGHWDTVARQVPVTIGEWQPMEISVIGPRISVKVDGEIVSEYVDYQPGRELGQIRLVSGKTSVMYRKLFIQEFSEIPEKAPVSANSLNPTPESAFVPLPIPQDFSGWRKWGKGTATWEISNDGVLTISAGGNDSNATAQLMTSRRDYRDFRLRFDVLSPDDIPKYVCIRGTVNEANHTKSAYQILVAGADSPHDQNPGTVGSIHASHNVDRSAGVLDWTVRARKVPTPIGECLSIEIAAIGRQITTSVGGQIVAEYTDDQPGCETGGIYLVCPKSSVQFKNMRIQEIPVP